ncbi:MAG: OB-fold nucleic acid binding domain-containing protein, partial [Desulfomonilia bacterium]|nr:OB-fold nucleic acid binding domain-containing protein [Desulfomonilia bacterium]
MENCFISDFSRHVDERVTVQGWVANRRSSGRVSFLILRDGTGICQAIVERDTIGDIYPEIKKLPLESSLRVHGHVVKEERSP